MRRIGLCIGLLWSAALGVITLTVADVAATPLGSGLIDHESDGRVYPAQDLPFPEATIVVVLECSPFFCSPRGA